MIQPLSEARLAMAEADWEMVERASALSHK